MNLVAVNYRIFSWSCNTKGAAHGVAELSELDPVRNRWQDLGHDKKGVMVQGVKNIIPFVITTEEYDDEGDVILWRLVSDHSKFPDCTLTIFND
jgi:hypothetical protein